jgi:hypothetical protein
MCYFNMQLRQATFQKTRWNTFFTQSVQLLRQPKPRDKQDFSEDC